MSEPSSEKPAPSAPNAILGLWILSGKSAPQISREIKAQTGVDISSKAIIRAARQGTGIGKAKWAVLAKYFEIDPWQLHDPTLPERLDPHIGEKIEKILSSSVTNS